MTHGVIPPHVKTGIQVLEEDSWSQLRGCKLGVVTNATGVFPDMRHLVSLSDCERLGPVRNMGVIMKASGGFQAGQDSSMHFL